MKWLMKFVFPMLLITAFSTIDAASQEFKDSSQSKLTDDDLELLKDALVLTVADPYATQIIKVRKTTDGFCGLLNSKNQYGGYTGFKPFKFIPARAKLYIGFRCD